MQLGYKIAQGKGHKLVHMFKHKRIERESMVLVLVMMTISVIRFVSVFSKNKATMEVRIRVNKERTKIFLCIIVQLATNIDN